MALFIIYGTTQSPLVSLSLFTTRSKEEAHHQYKNIVQQFSCHSKHSYLSVNGPVISSHSDNKEIKHNLLHSAKTKGVLSTQGVKVWSQVWLNRLWSLQKKFAICISCRLQFIKLKETFWISKASTRHFTYGQQSAGSKDQVVFSVILSQIKKKLSNLEYGS